MKENITIGIEGLVGAGKTSLCRELLNMIPNSIILHGGNLYRGIVYALMTSNIDFKQMMSNPETMKNLDIKELMERLKVEIKIEDKQSVVYVSGKEINEDNLQSDETSLNVSKIAKEADNSKFYAFGATLIDMYKKQYNLIISGRDLMRIYPKLDYHFFITADLETRVDRKLGQYENANREEIKNHIIQRDKLQEQSGFYDRFDKTIDIDVTDCKTPEESAKKVLAYIKL